MSPNNTVPYRFGYTALLGRMQDCCIRPFIHKATYRSLTVSLGEAHRVASQSNRRRLVASHGAAG